MSCDESAIRIETSRLILREFDTDDHSQVHAYASDPEVVLYEPWGPNSQEDTREFVRRALTARQVTPRVQMELAVTLKPELTIIGGCGIRLNDPLDKNAELGYCFARLFWGKGYATEAAQQLLKVGFEVLGAHRIIATCDPRNLASVRVLEKIGMRREAHFKEHKWVKGKWRDSLLYAILDHEWLALGSG